MRQILISIFALTSGIAVADVSGQALQKISSLAGEPPDQICTILLDGKKGGRVERLRRVGSIEINDSSIFTVNQGLPNAMQTVLKISRGWETRFSPGYEGSGLRQVSYQIWDPQAKNWLSIHTEIGTITQADDLVSLLEYLCR